MVQSCCHNVITIDLEEWFHGLEPDPRQWSKYERRSYAATEMLLRLFQEYDTKATFFVLGDVAKESPELVREIAEEGHEVGSHGMYHEFIYKQSRDEFRQDLRKSLDILNSIIDKPIASFRAPYFSITRDSLWALDILGEEGISHDSSVFPVHNPRYGIPGASRLPYLIMPDLWEWPVATLSSFLGNIPCGGGFYIRFWPPGFTRFALNTIEKKQEPMLLYFHPWEFDPEQPRIRSGSRFSDLRHYFNLDKTLKRFRKILVSRNYTTLANGIQNLAGTDYINN